ncbi:MAG: RNA polymerase sigma factor [Gemmatimonadota bacterium]
MEERSEEMVAELERHHSDSFGWALSCCDGDEAEAEDVLQTAYLKVLEGRARFDGRSSLETWMFAVIRRTAAERRRKKAVRLAALLRWRDPGSPAMGADPEGRGRRSERSEILLAALGKLSRRQREVLHLVFYQDLTIEEASRVLAISLGTARTHYERGKKRLRELLAETLER